ncbi:MAG TPA: hypothetical protein DCE08_05960 [Ruminococcaceae bacterium]|nr:hypothetical protein [Oscillospiraceae bacterium]
MRDSLFPVSFGFEALTFAPIFSVRGEKAHKHRRPFLREPHAAAYFAHAYLKNRQNKAFFPKKTIPNG